jgi:AcrR family transcriptional regulator
MDLFSQDCFEGVIVAEVARSAGVTEKAVFNHFVAKENLVYSTDRSFEEDLVTAMRRREVEISIYGAATAFPVSRYTASRADGQTAGHQAIRPLSTGLDDYGTQST